jgi:hypothetical protein
VSRAEPQLPPAPRIGGVLRSAAEDFFYNSWRFLGGNLVLGLVLLAIGMVAVYAPIALLALPLAAAPAAGLMRMATVLVRDGHCDFGDMTAVMRRPLRWLVVGAVQVGLLAVLLVDMNAGAAIGGTLGAFVTVSALYGVLVWWLLALVTWPLLLDPVRDEEPIPARLKLAAMLLLAHPLRILAVGVLLAVFLVLSTISVAPLVTVSVAVAWLVAARYVLPAADRLEGRRTMEPAED